MRGQPGRADRADELRRFGVLDEEADGTVAECVKEVFVERERGEDHDSHACQIGIGDDPPCRLQAVELGHPDVHQHHVRLELAGQRDRLATGRRLGNDLDVLARFEQRLEPAADEPLIVGQQRPDHADPPIGRCAETSKPPTARWCASR
jgi:hypothetical protein